MKLLKIAIFLSLAAPFAVGQATVKGEVVDVVNGKTVMLMLPAGKTLVELQYIEVPEPEQQLHSTVIEHLKKLTIGKRAEYKAIRMLKTGTVGRLMVGGVDVSQQMLRDGAAWHASIDRTGQEKNQYDDYAASERSARDEKRGVWEVEGMKPAWEFRAEKAEAERAAEMKAAGKVAPGPKNSLAAALKNTKLRPKGVWSDTDPNLGNVGAFATGYNAGAKTGFVSTTPMGISTAGTMLPPGTRATLEITYLYKQPTDGKREGMFVVTLVSVASEWSFLKENNLEVHVDEKKINIGKPRREAVSENDLFIEKLTYYIDRTVIEKIGSADEAFLKVGKNAFKPTGGWNLLLYNLAQVAK